MTAESTSEFLVMAHRNCDASDAFRSLFLVSEIPANWAYDIRSPEMTNTCLPELVMRWCDSHVRTLLIVWNARSMFPSKKASFKFCCTYEDTFTAPCVTDTYVVATLNEKSVSCTSTCT